MQNEIDKSGRVEASKIGVLQCIWKHVIGTTVGLEPFGVQCGSVEPTAEAQFKINLKATWMFT